MTKHSEPHIMELQNWHKRLPCVSSVGANWAVEKKSIQIRALEEIGQLRKNTVKFASQHAQMSAVKDVRPSVELCGRRTLEKWKT
jgi:hypothetical protein